MGWREERQPLGVGMRRYRGRRRIGMTAGVLVAGLLTGCGAGSSPTQSSTSTPPVANTPAVASVPTRTSQPTVTVTQPATTAAPVIVPSPRPAPAPTSQTYVNARYGFSVSHPAGMTSHESDNGDGATFNREGVTVTAYGANVLASRPTLASVVADMQGEGISVTYRAGSATSFSASGLDGRTVVYTRYLVGNRSYAVLQWRYPVSAKAEMDGPVTASVASFRAGDLTVPH